MVQKKQTVSQIAENQELTQEQVQSHEAEMIAKADNSAEASMSKDNPELTSEGEGLLAGKYKTPEDLEKAYKELESRLGKSEETKVEEDGEAKEPEGVPKTQEEAKEIVDSKGLDFNALNTEYADNGQLSEETYKHLENAGINRATVDAYIEGQEALAQRTVQEFYTAVGGEDNYNEMLAWAAETLPDSDKNSFNDAVTANESMAKFAIEGLYARYRAEAGEPNLIDSGNTQTRSSGYQSKAEMIADMASPRYKKDPAFRELVQLKVAKSNI